MVTLFTRRKQVTTVAVEDEVKELGVGRSFGAALVLLWGGLLVASIIARSKTSYSDFKILHWSAQGSAESVGHVAWLCCGAGHWGAVDVGALSDQLQWLQTSALVGVGGLTGVSKVLTLSL